MAFKRVDFCIKSNLLYKTHKNPPKKTAQKLLEANGSHDKYYSPFNYCVYILEEIL